MGAGPAFVDTVAKAKPALIPELEHGLGKTLVHLQRHKCILKLVPAGHVPPPPRDDPLVPDLCAPMKWRFGTIQMTRPRGDIRAPHLRYVDFLGTFAIIARGGAFLFA